MKNSKTYIIGMVGLGVMGRNLLLNMADHGFSVAGYDNAPTKVETLQREAGKRDIHCTNNLQEFLSILQKPRAIILLVPAGAPVDAVIAELLVYLQKDDLIIDSGNSYFKDTNLRTLRLQEKGIQFMGMGISGGSEGARHGASIMPGGSKESFERVRLIFEAVAAKVNDEPCVSYIGPQSAGHFVKMVHNGIEYGIMQLISETYAFMKLVLGFSDDELQKTYNEWNNGELNGYLMEITSNIFGKVDEKTDKRLIDEILDVARQKGTGMWTSQSAMELQVPVPTIDMAVAMRDLSVFENQREIADKIFQHRELQFTGDWKKLLTQLRKAFYVSTLTTYTQGFALLTVASNKYGYHLDLETVARIWRGGCIIRAAILEDIKKAFHEKPDLANLMLDPNFSQNIKENQEDLRQIVCTASSMGIPIPGLMASLSYLDAFQSSWLPANLIQAQRDYFGGHTYERIDAKGTFHSEWQNE
ncbi:NADP-dependent phosphogluconate dehydrogenase [Marinilabilia sp.]|uniref:NADP-dependent phosphogluconate dehydrogenase n=1 Tax=Marinilabilia sp. TaxID=2021252 RepID=UPI0025BF2FBB|nr:NADP-dependent phosphogluconate dehydrogenase [Marinilabilia sp.]